MSLEAIIGTFTESMLFIAGLFLVLGSFLITVKSRFIQVRLLSSTLRVLFSSLFSSGKEGNDHTVPPYKALFTAMSTTAGIGTMVAPVIAIHFGGPGALLGFLLTSFLGSAATFTEVALCIQYKEKRKDGSIIGGPMTYLRALFSPIAARWYALLCLVLMVSWSGAQSNQMAALFDSPLLGEYRISKALCGFAVASLVVFFLMGGIKRIGTLATKLLLPAHFILYVAACLWIIGTNYDRLGEVLSMIFSSFSTPYQMASGAVVGGVVSAVRWGIFKGIHVCEGGIGTQTIPHSMAETDDPVAQGTLAMLSTYTAGFISFLSGLVSLLTGTWQCSELPVGMSMVAASFQLYFSSLGIVIVAVSVLLFGFGTILGNSYNGSECFCFLSERKRMKAYFLTVAGVVLLGALSDVKVFWSFTDSLLAVMAILHMSALVYAAFVLRPQEVETRV